MTHGLQRVKSYARLMRLDKPIGAILLLWPTLWALWIAANGQPKPYLLIYFLLGIFIMRSAGCVINDIADRKFDPHVKRTSTRPLAAGDITIYEALALLGTLLLCALMIAFQLPRLALLLSLPGAIFTIIYPFSKRYIQCPQMILGVCFAWGVPMAFAATNHHLSPISWHLFLIAVLWPIAYDTMYAMVDRADDLKIGIHSMAIFLGSRDTLFIAFIQSMIAILWVMLGIRLNLPSTFYIFLALSILLMIYQVGLIRNRQEKACFKAFMNNQWVGLLLFLGLFFSL